MYKVALAMAFKGFYFQARFYQLTILGMRSIQQH